MVTNHMPSPVDPVGGSASTANAWPLGKKSAFFTAFVAFSLGLFDLIDRQVMAALFPYLKAEYTLTDTQLGALMSSVNIAIAVLVVPSAYFIDRWSRKKMIFLMGVVWSLATLACAFAGSYAQLLFARFICGAGEAGYNPAAQSLLSASFPRRLRTTAASIVQFGMFLGAPLGMVIGAYVAFHFGWRHALGLVALPSLLLSFLALAVKDFKNERVSDDDKKKSPSYGAGVARMLRTPSLVCIYLAASLTLLYSSALLSWLPSYFNRVAHLPMTTASLISGVSMGMGAAIVIIVGPVIDWIRKSRPEAGAIWLAVSLFLGTVVAIYTYYFAVPGSPIQVFLVMTKGVFTGAVATIGMGMVLDLVPPSERGTAVGLKMLMQNIFGMAIGPVLAGFLSDRFGLQMALVYSSMAMMIASLLYIVCIFTFPRDLAKVTQKQAMFE